MVAPAASVNLSGPNSPAPPTLLGRVRLAAGDIKLAHSVFALPFAVLGVFLARPADAPPGRLAGQLALVVVCMVLARTWAMLVNRWADADIDAANPRTAGRAVASGRLRRTDAAALALASAAGFCAGAWAFWPLFGNPWPTYLCVPVLAWLALYSFAKRFTALCHLLLGSALAISPLAAALAVDPAAIGRVPALLAISGMVLLWVAGFDIIYALQDVEADRRQGLHSLPSRLGAGQAGPRRAIALSRVLHAGAAALLAWAWTLDPRLGWPFAAGLVLVVVLLVAEHLVLHRRGLAGLPMAFFTLNRLISCVVGVLGVADVLWA